MLRAIKEHQSNKVNMKILLLRSLDEYPKDYTLMHGTTHVRT